jgi:hypothetical protein
MEGRDMPSSTQKQRKMMAIAEHEPSKLYKRNRGVLKMSKAQLHDFATKAKNSTKGSPSFTEEEIGQGYRSIPWPSN